MEEEEGRKEDEDPSYPTLGTDTNTNTNTNTNTKTIITHFPFLLKTTLRRNIPFLPCC